MINVTLMAASCGTVIPQCGSSCLNILWRVGKIPQYYGSLMHDDSSVFSMVGKRWLRMLNGLESGESWQPRSQYGSHSYFLGGTRNGNQWANRIIVSFPTFRHSFPIQFSSMVAADWPFACCGCHRWSFVGWKNLEYCSCRPVHQVPCLNWQQL